jgi:hypothetical protein
MQEDNKCVFNLYSDNPKIDIFASHYQLCTETPCIRNNAGDSLQ